MSLKMTRLAEIGATTKGVYDALDSLLGSAKVYNTIVVPVESLAGLTNGAKLVDAMTLGFSGKIEKIDFVTGTTPASTASKDASLSILIGTTAVTGGALALTTAACNAKGKVVAGSAITAANDFLSTDTITIVAGNPTAVFSEGNGKVVLTVSQRLQ